MFQTAAHMISVLPKVRQASARDVPALTALVEVSVRHLNSQHYTMQQLESALTYVFAIDTELIEDGTYYVAEIDGKIVGCGGWSRRDRIHSGREIQVSVVSTQSDRTTAMSRTAKIRAVYVHPEYARRGIGRRLMQVSETAAQRDGFNRLELLATLTGEPLYQKCGFVSLQPVDLLMPTGISLQALQMEKWL